MQEGCQSSEQGPTAAIELETLTSRCLGNLELVERVLNIFQQSVEKDLADMERGLLTLDSSEVARAAHRIKGAAGNVAANGLHREAAAIEAFARTERMEEVFPCAERLRQAWRDFCVARPALSDTEC